MKILIADDEHLARARLRSLLDGQPDIEIVGESADGRDAVLKAQNLGADVLLLDIRMPLMDGLEAAQHIATLDPQPAVIFCTAYDEYAVRAFEAQALDYLVKPIRRERLLEALSRARRLVKPAQVEQAREALDGDRRRTHLCARLRGNLHLVPVAEISHLQAEDKYVVVNYPGGAVLVEDTLKSLESEFSEQFVRIHRNCLVARDRIRALKRLPDGGVVAELEGVDGDLEVSRRNLPGLRKLVKHL
jgi:two-component system, LytTR family, response regulator AlgR